MGSTPTICAKSSTLRGAAFYFCGKLCKGCKVGFEQPVPGAMRPAACAKYHYSILHWVVIFYCHFAKFRCFSYRHLPFIFK